MVHDAETGETEPAGTNLLTLHRFREVLPVQVFIPHRTSPEPLAARGSPEVQATSPRERSAEESRLLLIVEDNGADVFLIRRAIQTYGLSLQVHVCSDGEEALRYIDQAESDPTVACPFLLLLDLNLPKKSGSEVLERVRNARRWSAIPVVVVTSSDSLEDRQQAAELGANHYFRKPASYREFLKIGEILQEYLPR
jgi:CheY-like chemotaxis protein